MTRVRGVPVGVARFIRADDDPASADVAIAVVDDWQSRGVGSLLATRLSARAVGEDISHFTALMAAGNLRARRLLGRLGEVRVADRDGATVTYRVALSGSAVVRSRPRFTSRGARPVGVTAAYLR